MPEYAKRDHLALGEHYLRHVSAMTGEGLHAKSAIAAELAWRDAEIERLRSEQMPDVDDINAQRWAGMDASTAFWLIQRHADDWQHAGRLLNAWRLANPAATEAARATGKAAAAGAPALHKIGPKEAP